MKSIIRPALFNVNGQVFHRILPNLKRRGKKLLPAGNCDGASLSFLRHRRSEPHPPQLTPRHLPLTGEGLSGYGFVLSKAFHAGVRLSLREARIVAALCRSLRFPDFASPFAPTGRARLSLREALIVAALRRSLRFPDFASPFAPTGRARLSPPRSFCSRRRLR